MQHRIGGATRGLVGRIANRHHVTRTGGGQRGDGSERGAHLDAVDRGGAIQTERTAVHIDHRLVQSDPVDLQYRVGIHRRGGGGNGAKRGGILDNQGAVIDVNGGTGQKHARSGNFPGIQALLGEPARARAGRRSALRNIGHHVDGGIGAVQNKNRAARGRAAMRDGTDNHRRIRIGRVIDQIEKAGRARRQNGI